jgi:hypothetical protein
MTIAKGTPLSDALGSDVGVCSAGAPGACSGIMSRMGYEMHPVAADAGSGGVPVMNMTNSPASLMNFNIS